MSRRLLYRDAKKILNNLNNEKWGLDFVSATAGDCCNTCGEMRTEKETIAFNNANTFLVFKWFFKGMNYQGKFDEQDIFYINWVLPDDKNLLFEVCSDLKNAFKFYGFDVIVPDSKSSAIILTREEPLMRIMETRIHNSLVKVGYDRGNIHGEYYKIATIDFKDLFDHSLRIDNQAIFNLDKLPESRVYLNKFRADKNLVNVDLVDNTKYISVLSKQGVHIYFTRSSVDKKMVVFLDKNKEG